MDTVEDGDGDGDGDSYRYSGSVLRADSDRHAAGEAVAGGHRGAARGHNEAGEVDPRAARHVPGHGDAGGVAG